MINVRDVLLQAQSSLRLDCFDGGRDHVIRTTLITFLACLSKIYAKTETWELLRDWQVATYDQASIQREGLSEFLHPEQELK